MGPRRNAEAVSENTPIKLGLIIILLGAAGTLLVGTGILRFQPAEASERMKQYETQNAELRQQVSANDHRIQRLEDQAAFTNQMLQRIDHKLDQLDSKGR